MGILDNLLGANVDPMQMQIASLLGVQMDPKQLQRRSRAEGLSRIGQALMQAGGGAGGTLSALGAGLQDARGAGDDVVGRELQRAMQFKQLQESQAQLKARAAMQEQMKTLLPQALKNLPPEVAQLVSLQAASGDPTMMNKAFETILNPPQPKMPSNKAQLALAMAQGDPAAKMAYEKLVADEQARAQAGRTNVNVAAPDIGAAIAAANEAALKKRAQESGGGLAATVDELNKNAQAFSKYAKNVDLFNQLAGEDQVVGGGLGVQAKELVTSLGLGDKFGIDQKKLANQRTAQSLATEIGIEKLAGLGGSDTNQDFTRVLEAGPALQQTPEGRRVFGEVTKAQAERAQRLAEAANRLSQQVEAGQLTVEQARERLRQEQEKTWLSPDLSKKINTLTGGSGTPIRQPAAPASDGWGVEVIGG